MLTATQDFIPESRLPIAMVGAIILPISLFWFGWTSSPHIHWISPVIAAGFYSAATYLLLTTGLKCVLFTIWVEACR